MGRKGTAIEYSKKWWVGSKETGWTDNDHYARRRIIETVDTTEWRTRKLALDTNDAERKERLQELLEGILVDVDDSTWLKREEPNPRNRSRKQLELYVAWLDYLIKKPVTHIYDI